MTKEVNIRNLLKPEEGGQERRNESLHYIYSIMHTFSTSLNLWNRDILYRQQSLNTCPWPGGVFQEQVRSILVMWLTLSHLCMVNNSYVKFNWLLKWIFFKTTSWFSIETKVCFSSALTHILPTFPHLCTWKWYGKNLCLNKSKRAVSTSIKIVL